jgi:hypothetical protein
VGKTKLTGKLLHLEPEKAAMLADLTKRSGVRQSVLMRSAIDLLLEKHGYEWERDKPLDQPPRRVHRLRKKGSRPK